jgi:hypothetical protein
VTDSTAGWKCYLAHHGLALRKAGDGPTRFLPPDAEDVILKDIPLSFVLTDNECELLWAKPAALTNSAVAATHYGPADQDKTSNEDFAIAAVVHDAKGAPWSFAAVADGVGTKTFWAARTSRIACLVAFREFRAFIDRAETLNDGKLEEFRKSLAIALREELHRERKLLLDGGEVPSRWTPEYFSQFKDRDELWFNSTLIVAALGEWSGFALWAGDGGIHLRKTHTRDPQPTDSVVMASTEDSRLESCVSLRVVPNQFRIARIGYDDSRRVEIYLSSDGVDRTLQRQNDGGYPKLSLHNFGEASGVLSKLAAAKEAERDNMSVARISHDISAEVVSTLAARKEQRAPETPEVLPEKLPEELPRDPEPVRAPNATQPEPEKPKQPILTRHIVYFLIVMFVGVSGFSAGVLVMARLYAMERPTAGPVRVRPKPKPVVPPKGVPQLPQLAIDDVVKKALTKKTQNEAIQRLIAESVAAIKEQPGVYTLVAYADRGDATSREDCKTNAAVSLARSETVTAWIRAALPKNLPGAAILNAQRVCDPPQPDILITNARARRLVLARGEVHNCECKQGDH